MSDANRIDCDVLIVGGGLVGSVLANALSTGSLRTVLVEARSVDTLAQPSFDGRVTALANGSQRVLEQLGLWGAIRADAQPIRHIHIGQRGRFGAARIDAREERVPALGYTVENRTLGAALWQSLSENQRFRYLSPAEVVNVECTSDGVTAKVEFGESSATINASLLVAADGSRSKLRAALGISARVDDYEQQAIIVNCTTQEAHRARAFERFTADGPIAVLPLTRDRVGVVWTLPTEAVDRVFGLTDNAFRSALQAAFGYRLGRFEKIGRRDRHPLHRVRSGDLTHERTVLIGNAAIALHPVAGQGFNLALRDAAALAEVIADTVRDGLLDVGSAAVLERYRAWRTGDQRKLAGFTHLLVRGFGVEALGLGRLRGAGLMAFDAIPGAKSLLARHTMGLAGRVPRLARYLNLAE